MHDAESASRCGCRAVIGVILAGGNASRMGGGDKGLQIVGGRPILDRVAEVLRAGCHPILLNANGDPARFASFGLEVLADSLPGRPGPLAGVLAALDWVAAYRPAIAEVVTAPADTPFLPSNLVARLAAGHRRAEAVVTCARSGGIRHPVAALWTVAVRSDLRRVLVEQGLRKMGDFLDRLPMAYVDWPCDPVDPFFNVNTPDELDLANGLAAKLEQGQRS